MGMYDTVRAECPKCNGRIEFQSKAGRCSLTNYDLDSVPFGIADDLDGDTASCEGCGEVYSLIVGSQPKRVQMNLVVGPGFKCEEDEDY